MSGMGGGDITTLTGNVGGLIPASGSGNFNIVGAGGVTVTGTSATHTLTITGAGAVAITNHALAVGTGVTITSLALGGTGVILQGNAGADPSWSTATYPSTVTKGDVLIASANNVVGVVNDVVNAGYVLTANAAAAPTFQTLPAPVVGSFASDAETIAGTESAKAVAPSNLKAKLGLQTVHALPVGNSDSLALDWLAVGPDGTVLVGNTGADPSFSANPIVTNIKATTFDTNVVAAGVTLSGTTLSADGTDADININITAKGTGTVIIDELTLTTDLAVTEGGTGASTLTDHSILLGSGTGAITPIAVGANGETIMGATGADCGWTSSPQFGGSVTALNDISSTAGDIVSIGGSLISRDATNTATGPDLLFQKVRAAATIQSGDELGLARFTGYDGTQYITGAKITSTNSGTVAATRVAGDLKFYTHPDSAVALPSEPTLRMTIASTGATTIASPDSGIGLTVSGGGITCSSGTIAASSGAVSASTTVTAGTDLVSTSGVLKLPATSSTVGQIRINNNTVFHTYGGDGTAAQSNLFIGRGAGNYTNSTVYGAGIGIGAESLASCVYAGENFAMGYKTLNALTGTANSGYRNVALGNYALYRIVGGNNVADNGSYNTCIGYNSGGNLTGNEYNNIFLNYTGVAGQTGRFQVGASTGTGTGTGVVNEAYICGIYGRTPAGTQNICLVDSNNQLGSVATLPPSLGGAMTWTEVTGTSQAAAVNNGYITNNVALVTVTLPSTAAVGQRVAITGKGAGLWSIAQNAGQTIHYGSFDTTTGVTGSVTASVRYDCVEVQCTTANTDWVVIRSVGALVIA